MLKRYEWKILKLIKVDYKGKTTLKNLAKRVDWEEWKADAISELIKNKLLKYETTNKDGQLSFIKLTLKGELFLIIYSKRFAEKKFKIVTKQSTDQLSSVKETINSHFSNQSNYKHSKSDCKKPTTNLT